MSEISKETLSLAGALRRLTRDVPVTQHSSLLAEGRLEARLEEFRQRAFEEGENKQAILELHGRDRFLAELKNDYVTQVDGVLKNPVWPDGVEDRKLYYRIDDGAKEKDYTVLSAMIDSQGDVSLSIRRDLQSLGVLFCSRQGGGRSPHTRAALLYLIRAIQLDTEARPQPELQ